MVPELDEPPTKLVLISLQSVRVLVSTKNATLRLTLTGTALHICSVGRLEIMIFTASLVLTGTDDPVSHIGSVSSQL